MMKGGPKEEEKKTVYYKPGEREDRYLSEKLMRKSGKGIY
jgi:hypothetical protein